MREPAEPTGITPNAQKEETEGHYEGPWWGFPPMRNALATASVGIAMGVAGTDAAIEAADVALMGDDLRAVVYAIQVGRSAQAISRQNIIFSIALLAVLVPAAALGMIGVAVAVLAHEGSELLAVANGLRSGVLPKNV